jgi:hypothetical protein
MKKNLLLGYAPCILLLFAMSGSASAQNIYKCTHGGRVEYTDHPCATGTGELLHKADDTEIIDQYLDLGQVDVAKRYASSRHLDALYETRLAAYKERMQQRSEQAAAAAQADALEAQQRDEAARQQAWEEHAAERDRLRAENDALRQENQQIRDQQSQPVYYAPTIWVPPYWGHDHGKPRPPQPPQPTPLPVKPPAYHPCRQLAGGHVQC